MEERMGLSGFPGNTNAIVKVFGADGKEKVSLPGVLVSGGVLSLTQELQPGPQEKIRIFCNSSRRVWNVKNTSFPAQKKKGRFVYHLNLSLA
jgi:hypothetical protein